VAIHVLEHVPACLMVQPPEGNNSCNNLHQSRTSYQCRVAHESAIYVIQIHFGMINASYFKILEPIKENWQVETKGSGKY